jgi:aminoglycoside phosphotransferase (APT) family kinase protein
MVACDVSTSSGPLRITAKALRLPALDKLEKVRRLEAHRSGLGPAAFVDSALGVAVTAYPWDVRVPVLGRLVAGRTGRRLREAVPQLPRLEPRLTLLSYKPERRAVLRADLGDLRLVVRAYEEREFTARVKFGENVGGVPMARTLGRHPRLPLVVTGWIEGVDGTGAFDDATVARDIGAALAVLHRAPVGVARMRTVEDERSALRASARAIADLVPSLAGRVDHLAGALAERLEWRGAARTIHGDFAFRQVVCSPGGPVFADLDEMTTGAPAADLGSALADIDVQALSGRVAVGAAQGAARGLLAGYGEHDPQLVGVQHALSLLRMAPLPFRHRDPEWPRAVAAIVERADSLPWRATRERSTARPGVTSRPPSGSDEAMPWLAAALDPSTVTAHVRPLGWAGHGAEVVSCEVRRHKVGRRCLVQYRVRRADGREVVALGKTRCRGLDTKTARLMQSLEAGGFGADAADGIRVPAYLGTIDPLRMWLQEEVDGEVATARAAEDRSDLGARLARTVAKLQARGPLPSRIHSLADEGRTLGDRLRALAERRPHLSHAVEAVRRGCLELAAGIPDVPLAPAHRDFHPDQVLVTTGSVFLLDLDLYALAHPALDASNCVAHLVELSLRSRLAGEAPGRARGYERAARDLEEAFVPRLQKRARAGFGPLVTLALARLVEIADRMEARRHAVEPLLDLCAARFAAPVVHGVRAI